MIILPPFPYLVMLDLDIWTCLINMFFSVLYNRDLASLQSKNQPNRLGVG